MTGLADPMPHHQTTQHFEGGYFNPATGIGEPKGYLSTPADPWRARATSFLGAVFRAHLHKAVDKSCPVGTPVLAPETGKLVLQAIDPATGDHYAYLEIRPGTVIAFSHLSKVTVPVGTIVKRGAKLALSGATGHVTGPHLHWSVRHTGGADTDFRKCSSWMRYNPLRLLVGGDKAGTPWIRPLGT